MIDLSRTAALLGEEGVARLWAARVAVIGVGGVGSWCAEALVRTGVGHVTLVDDDSVQPSNVNRQCPATARTLGRAKVDVMRERLLAINPEADVRACCGRYPEGFAGLASLAPTAVVDAIDSVGCKADLIREVTALGIPLVSSMGAALRLDPTQVRITGFDKVVGDGLARALRTRFKREGRFPAARFSCVWSAETPRSLEIRGSVMPVTCAFGMAIAAEIVRILVGGSGASA